MMRCTRRIVVVALVLAGATAAADPKTLVFPLATQGLPGELADASPAVTRALADSIGAGVAKVSIDVAAEVLGCDAESTSCLEQVADSLAAQRLVFGTIARSDGALRVTLTRFDRGPARQQRTFDLAARTRDELVTAVVRAAAPLFARAQPESATPPLSPPPPLPAPGDRAPAQPTITTGTWLVTGTGAALAAVGGGFLWSAHGLRDEVASAPKQTDADFLRLVELEHRGRTRAYTGDALVAVGGAVVVAGVIRAVVQSKSKRGDSAAPRVTVALVAGGAALVLTTELR